MTVIPPPFGSEIKPPRDLSFTIFEPLASSFVSDSFDDAGDGADRMNGGEAKDISPQRF
jgi:hypothetical protein